VEWDPKTKLGNLVRKGEIKTMSGALKSGLPLREPEIVDVLLPEIDDEVIDVNMVQRMTDSGRRVKFVITVAVGNNDGFVGFGQAKGKEVGSSIRKAIENAKLNVIEIRRGCGSWECGCKKPHTVPFAINGKSGSVEITLKPAPQGIGLATGNVAKKILTLAGVKDCWAFTKGKTKTTVNYAKAVFNALEENAEMRVLPSEVKKVGIVSGDIGLPKEEQPQQEPTEQIPKQKDESKKEEQPKSEKPEEKPPKEDKKPEETTPEPPKEEPKEEPTEEPPKEEEKPVEEPSKEGKKEDKKK
jgi:small subunit ribosomal protein S5